MLARICLLLILAESAKELRKFTLEEITEVNIYPGEHIEIYSPTRPKTMNSWVIGRFPSNKISPMEGRLGDRNFNQRDSDGRRLQKFTIIATNASPGDELPMDFWLIKPQYAEQYYNDPSAYEAMHGENPETKVVTFRVVVPEL